MIEIFALHLIAKGFRTAVLICILFQAVSSVRLGTNLSLFQGANVSEFFKPVSDFELFIPMGDNTIEQHFQP